MVSRGGYSQEGTHDGFTRRLLTMVYSQEDTHDGFTGKALTTFSRGGYSRRFHREGTHDGFTGRVLRRGYSRRFHREGTHDGFTGRVVTTVLRKRLLGTFFLRSGFRNKWLLYIKHRVVSRQGHNNQGDKMSVRA